MHRPNHSRNSRFAGAMFVVAIAASLTGGTLIQGVLDQPDVISSLSSQQWVVFAGVCLELINALAVIGIVAALWTPLVQGLPGTTVGYLGVRIVEVTICVAAALVPVVLLSLAEQDSFPGRSGVAELLSAVRAVMVGVAVPLLFGAGAVILYVMLFRSAIVPRYISIWGMIGAAGVLSNVVVADPALQPVFVLPIITNELYLGVYLLVKGLREEESTIRRVRGAVVTSGAA